MFLINTQYNYTINDEIKAKEEIVINETINYDIGFILADIKGNYDFSIRLIYDNGTKIDDDILQLNSRNGKIKEYHIYSKKYKLTDTFPISFVIVNKSDKKNNIIGKIGIMDSENTFFPNFMFYCGMIFVGIFPIAFGLMIRYVFELIIRKNYQKKLRTKIKYGTDVNTKLFEDHNDYFEPLLIHEIRKNGIQNVGALLKQGAKTNLKDKENINKLFHHLSQNKDPMAKELIKYGFEIPKPYNLFSDGFYFNEFNDKTITQLNFQNNNFIRWGIGNIFIKNIMTPFTILPACHLDEF